MERRNRHLEETPARLEYARQRVIAGVTALGDTHRETPATVSSVRAQQALIIANLESLSEEREDAPMGARAGSECLWREKWIDGLPCTD